MSILSPTPPPVGTDELLNRLQSRASDMARRSSLDNADALRALPPEIRVTELPWVTRRTLSTVFGSLRRNESPTGDELRPAREIAVQRADEGVPLSVVVRNWERGFQRFWSDASAAADPADADIMAYLGTALLALFGTFTATLVDAYEQEQVVLASETSSAGHLVARMMLDGQEARPYADRFRIELHGGYHVLALQIASMPDELVDDATGRLVAGRRKMRKILTLAEFRRSSPTLTTLGPAGGHVLLPVDPDSAASAYEIATQLVDRIRSAVDVDIRAGLVAEVPIGEVSRAGHLATEVLHLSAGHRAGHAVYLLDDVALEFQLTRPGPALDHIRDALTPIEPFPELIEFLECYLDCDMDRGRTAKTLGVHPNTVNNRLHKVASLTGIDPTGFAGVMAFGAALAVRKHLPEEDVAAG